MKQFRRGLVVGKFCPLHLGHESVIRRAMELCGRVFVISYTNPEFPGCEPERRRRWLSERFPDTHLLVLDGTEGIPIPPNDAADSVHRRFVGMLCREHLKTSVDAVFTSESYGDGFAAELTAFFRESEPSHSRVAHVSVDESRSTLPISGTLLRSEVHEHRQFLAPCVYADFVQRVALLGGESSGKTTLAAELARHFGTAWVPEFGRELWEQKCGRLDEEDMPLIAKTQIAREAAAARGANRFLFCDSTPLTTLFYTAEMFQSVPASLSDAAGRRYDLTILCAPDFPFVQDGTRRDAAFRARQHAWYLAEFAQRGIAYLDCSGPLAARVERVARTLGVA
jgi:NadR type nicotinamide-nucleotide adenylyltransferase